jgi:hypothetical protein
MNIARSILAVLALLSIAAGPAPVTMTAQAGSKLDAVARQLVATDLAEANQAGDTPLLLLGTAHLGGPRDRPALFIQLQSARECGSSGCSSSAYVRGPKGWRKVLDSVTGRIFVDGAMHKGMHDIIIDGHDRWVWNGSVYADTDSAPAVNLAPRSST